MFMKIGFIGGSGLYELGDDLRERSSVSVDTPFGPPSDDLVTGSIRGVDVVFLPRHGEGHTIMPGELNHRANIFAMKKLGATHIVSLSACGSLRKEMKPRDVVIVDQYFDRTKRGSEHTFFGNGVVAHIAFADPVCPELSSLAFDAAGGIARRDKMDITVHKGGTYINMEGPAFSTKAESNVYRSWGMDVIGMTNLAEAKLAREAGICYATMAFVTDYDCWHDAHDSVTVEMIVGNIQANSKLGRSVAVAICEAAKERLPRSCACADALKNAVITAPEKLTGEIKRRLAPILEGVI